MNDALVLQARPAEIEQKAQAQASCPKVVQALRPVDLVQTRDCLQFDHDAFIHQQIAEILADDLLSVSNIDGALLGDLMAVCAQLDGECVLIDLFQKPDTQGVADCLPFGRSFLNA